MTATLTTAKQNKANEIMISYKELPQFFVDVDGLIVRKVPRTKRLLADSANGLRTGHYIGYQAASGAETEMARIREMRRVTGLELIEAEKRMFGYTERYFLRVDDVLVDEYCDRTVADVMADVRAGVDVFAKCEEIKMKRDVKVLEGVSVNVGDEEIGGSQGAMVSGVIAESNVGQCVDDASDADSEKDSRVCAEVVVAELIEACVDEGVLEDRAVSVVQSFSESNCASDTCSKEVAVAEYVFVPELTDEEVEQLARDSGLYDTFKTGDCGLKNASEFMASRGYICDDVYVYNKSGLRATDVIIEDSQKVLRDLFPLSCTEVTNRDNSVVECTTFTVDIPYRAKTFIKVRDKFPSEELEEKKVYRVVDYLTDGGCVPCDTATCGPFPVDDDGFAYEQLIGAVSMQMSGCTNIDWKKFLRRDVSGFMRIVPDWPGVILDDCEYYTQEEMAHMMAFIAQDIDIMSCSTRELLHYVLMFAKLWNHDVAGRGVAISSLSESMILSSGRSVGLLIRVFEKLIDFLRAGLNFRVLSRVEGFRRVRERAVGLLSLYTVCDEHRQTGSGFGFSHLIVSAPVCDNTLRRRLLYDMKGDIVDLHWCVESDQGVTVSYANTIHSAVMRIYYECENVYVVYPGRNGRLLLIGPYATYADPGDDNNFVIKGFSFVASRRGSPVVGLDGQLLGVLLFPGDEAKSVKVLRLMLKA